MLQVENLDKVYTSSRFEKKQKRLPLAKISVICMIVVMLLNYNTWARKAVNNTEQKMLSAKHSQKIRQ